MLSFFQKLTAFYKRTIGGRVDFDNAFGYQCVDYVRAYASGILQPIGTFGGSAINGWKTGIPFKNTKWVRVLYKKGLEPNPGDIVFFEPTQANKYGHTAVAYIETNSTVLAVLEQNAGSGDGSGIGGNRVTVRKYPYTGAVVGNVLGWYTVQR